VLVPGDEQGPFDVAKMRLWYQNGHFPDDTPVRPEGEKEYMPLGERKDAIILFTKEDAPAAAAPAAAAPKAEAAAAAARSTPAASSAPASSASSAGSAGAAGAKGPAAEKKWYYIGPDGKELGPWSVKQMRAWHAKNFFTFNNTALRQEGEMVPLPLNQRPQLPDFALPEGAPAAAASQMPWAAAAAAQQQQQQQQSWAAATAAAQAAAAQTAASGTARTNLAPGVACSS
jgi:hypothetical protein